MYRFTASTEPRGGVLDIALPDPAEWNPLPFSKPGTNFGAALFGDPAAGPFAAMYSNAPREDPTPLTPGHGHGSDSWRIALLGTMRVGAQRYTPGAFRFQEGGMLYGADDSPWGPEGGYSIVMMGDRRGAGAIPANPKDAEVFKAGNAAFTKWLSISYGNRTVEQGVAATLGAPRFGRVDGSFEEEWPEIVPGVQFAAGLVGHKDIGPIVILTKAEPGKTVFPGLAIDSDVMHVVVRALGTQGQSALERFTVRLLAEQVAAEPIVAGDDGLWLATVIGDRRAWLAATGAGGSEALLADMRDRIAPLFDTVGYTAN